MAAGAGYIEFSTGDILTASAANQYLASQVVMVFADSAARTSAITSPQEGMISYLKDTDAVEKYTGSAWVSIGGTSSASGLTLITSQAFTASTAVNVNNVFSSTYYNYKIIIRITGGTAGGDSSITMRLRASGTDATTNYSGARGFFYSTTVGADSGSSWQPIDINSSDQVQSGIIELINPNQTAKTMGWAFTPKLNSTGLNIGITSSFQHTTASAYDGFSLTPGSGNTTGTVEVYGYAK
jgi:hypothetical protein